MNNLIIKIKEIAKNNPNGFTVDLELKPANKVGFSIGLSETQNSHTDDDLRNVIEVAIKKKAYIGGWLNRQNGKFYYDASLIVLDKDEAMKLGAENDQISIFDLENGIEIFI